MEKAILYELKRKLRHRPDLARKLKIFAVVGVIGFVVTTGLLIWAGVSAVSYVASKANQVVQSPSAQQQLEGLKSKLQTLPSLQVLACWGKAQSLMAVEPWLAQPALENLRSLKDACLEENPAVCEGLDCTAI